MNAQADSGQCKSDIIKAITLFVSCKTQIQNTYLLMQTEVPSKILIDRLFDLLDDWRNLPAYQLERRADIFFAIYLDVIIKTKYGHDVDFIVPEFPIRVGDISLKVPDLNRSFKIDYVAVCEAASTVYFVELETDATSRREKQDWYLEQAKTINIKRLIEGVIKIYSATGHKTKYNNLISLLSKIGWLLMDTGTCTNISKDYNIEVVYIQPIDDGRKEGVISFDDVICYLEKFDDALSGRFKKSLQAWKLNPNESLLVNDEV
jgi:hypothetical protein